MAVGTCRVEWRAMSAVVDSPDDPDRDPDVLPLAGLVVRFAAEVRRVAEAGGPEGPRTIFLNDITVTTDPDGYLVSPDGDRGVYLVASDADVEPAGFTWTVTISSPASLTPFSTTFFAPAGGTIDLATVLPAPPDPGADVPGWLAAVQTNAATAATAARDQAVPAAATASAAATTATNAATTATAARDATLAASTIVGAGRPDVPSTLT